MPFSLIHPNETPNNNNNGEIVPCKHHLIPGLFFIAWYTDLLTLLSLQLPPTARVEDSIVLYENHPTQKLRANLRTKSGPSRVECSRFGVLLKSMVLLGTATWSKKSRMYTTLSIFDDFLLILYRNTVRDLAFHHKSPCCSFGLQLFFVFASFFSRKSFLFHSLLFSCQRADYTSDANLLMLFSWEPSVARVENQWMWIVNISFSTNMERGSVSIPAVLWYTFESVLYLRFAAHDGSVNSIWCLPEQSEYRELSG